MALPVSFYGNRIADNTINNGKPETANWQIPITTLTAANYVAQAALLVTLQDAVGAVTIGNVQEKSTVIFRSVLSSGAASSVLAQRENKWLVRYSGNTLGKLFRVSLPTADLTKLPDHSEFLDLTTGVGQALKDALEAILKSPDDGAEACTVDSVQFVGRNT